MLASLEGTSMKAQQALESGTSVNLREAHNLGSYFQKASRHLAGISQGAAAWQLLCLVWWADFASRQHGRCYCRLKSLSSWPPPLAALHLLHTGCPALSLCLQVRLTAGKFEERLWSIIRNFLAVSQEDPGLLVTAVQVVELQEMVDAQLVAAGQGASPLRKAWRRRCLSQIAMCIQDSFAPLLQRCSQLIAAGENTDQRVTEILDGADDWVAQVGGGVGAVGLLTHSEGCSCHLMPATLLCCACLFLPPSILPPPTLPPQLVPIYDHVAPCFPPSYRIFGVVCAEHHRQLASMIDFIGLCADNLANADILKAGLRGREDATHALPVPVPPQTATAEMLQRCKLQRVLCMLLVERFPLRLCAHASLCSPFFFLFPQVMQWLAGYQESLGEFGLEEEEVAFPTGPQTGVSLLINTYVARIVATLSSWLSNIVEVRVGWKMGRQRQVVGQAWQQVSGAAVLRFPPSWTPAQQR